MKEDLRLNVVFYEKEDGTIPAAEFMVSLDEEMRAKITRSLKILEARGYTLRAPYSKELTMESWNCARTFGGNISSVLYFFVVGNTAVVAKGFIKKSQKTPPEEIQRAKTYRADYERRYLK